MAPRNADFNYLLGMVYSLMRKFFDAMKCDVYSPFFWGMDKYIICCLAILSASVKQYNVVCMFSNMSSSAIVL